MASAKQETPKAKEKHPGYKKMIIAAVSHLKTKADKKSIRSYIEDNYPSDNYKIAASTSVRFRKALDKALNQYCTVEKQRYKLKAIATQTTTKNRQGNAPHPPRQKHFAAAGEYSCCIDRAHIIKREHLRQILDEIQRIIQTRMSRKDKWMHGLEQLIEIHVNEHGLLERKDIEKILMEHCGYKKDKVQKEIMEHMNGDANGAVKEQSILNRTQAMHRFWCYRELSKELCKLGYSHYGENHSHPLYGVFVTKIRDGFPE
eukprot:216271_1